MDLAVYNTEVSRGIMHTEEWDAKMLRMQESYTKEMEAIFKADQQGRIK
jgi:hypothetical protein